MYQLFILKAYCDDLDLAMNDHNDKPLEKWMENLFGYPAIDRTIPLQAYCVEYIARPAVQGLFWEINDRIEIFLKENNVDVSKPLTQADLQKMATILWGKLCMKTQNYYRDRGRKIFAGNKSMTYYYDRYVELIPSACTIKSEHISAVIKVMLAELGTMKDPKSAGAHRLYRGANRGRISSGIVGDSSETTGDIGAPYSFSDGVFGGLLGDWKNGMAWALAVGKNGSLFYLDVQKSENVSSTSVYIPPLFCFGRTVINGMAAEYHHPRIKAFLPKNNYDCCWLLTSPVVEFKLEQLRKLELKKFCEEDREYSPKEFYTFHKGKLLSWNAHNLQEFPQEFSHLPRLTIGLQDYKMEWWRKLMDVLPGGDSTGFILDHYWEMMPWKFGSAGKQAYPSENPEYFTGDLKALENTMNAAVEMNIF
jgi:hypothetical protein